MIILAIDSSAVTASAAVAEYKDELKLLSCCFANNGNNHSRVLLEMAHSALSLAGAQLSDVSLAAVSAGPGSFTGVRIGVSTLKGLCFGRDIPCAGVSTLEGIARGCAVHAECCVCAVMDARRGQVYNALFYREGDKLTRLCEDRAISVQDLIKELPLGKIPLLVAGDGTKVLRGELSGGDIRFAGEPYNYQNAYGVALCAMDMYKKGQICRPEELNAVYLRLSQAERERMEKQ